MPAPGSGVLRQNTVSDNKQMPAPGSGVFRQNTVSDNKQLPAPGSGDLRQNTVSQCCKPNTKYSACHKPFQNRIVTRPPGHLQVHFVRVLLIDAHIHYDKMDNHP